MESKGSTNRTGYLYHEPAFPVEGIKFHRNDNLKRLEMFFRSQNWWNKNVLDLGCNVGYFSNHLSLMGARVTGIDTDEEAITFAQKQCLENDVENAIFFVPAKGHTYFKDKDILLALSVLPWIYETESNPEEYISKLFTIPVAYVEIQYPPDGRAMVPGVTDDASCKKYLEKYYKYVFKIGVTKDETEGVVRNRTMWKCMDDAFMGGPQSICYGSQADVQIFDHVVTKIARKGKDYDSFREAEFLKAMSDTGVSPRFATTDNRGLLCMERIQGWPLSSGYTTVENLSEQFNKIASGLEKAGICHNDIRPSNLIIGQDHNVYLIDFGWATWSGEEKPGEPNPVFGEETDRKLWKEY